MFFVSRLLQTLRFSKDLMFHPSKATKRTAASYTELVSFLVLAYTPFMILFVLSLSISAPIIGVEISVAIPIIISAVIGILTAIIQSFIYAGIVHGIGRLIRIYKKPFINTMSAIVYSSYAPFAIIGWIIPIIMTFLLLQLPSIISDALLFGSFGYLIGLYGLMLLVGMIVWVWSVVILVYGLSNQQATTKLKGFVPILIVIALFAIPYMIIIYPLASADLSGILSLGELTSQVDYGSLDDNISSQSSLILACSYAYLKIQNVGENGIVISNYGNVPISDIVVYDQAGKAGGAVVGEIPYLEPTSNSIVNWSSGRNLSVIVEGICEENFVVGDSCSVGESCWNIE